MSLCYCVDGIPPPYNYGCLESGLYSGSPAPISAHSSHGRGEVHFYSLFNFPYNLAGVASW